MALLGAVWVAALALWLDRFGHHDRAQAADAIVVLGARVLPGGVPGDSLRARTLQAVALYRRGLAPTILCTGGVGEHPPAEAEAAATLARQAGVPDAALLLEDRSTSTRENALFAAAIGRERGWRQVIVVSDPYHLWRARRAFARAGLTAYPSPATTGERDRKPLRRLQWTLRECLLVTRDLLFWR